MNLDILSQLKAYSVGLKAVILWQFHVLSLYHFPGADVLTLQTLKLNRMRPERRGK